MFSKRLPFGFLIRLVLTAVMAWSAFPGMALAAPTPGHRLAWQDDFDGTALDTVKWQYRTDTRYWSTQLPQNVSVSNGVLNLHLKKETVGSVNYTAGGVISRNLFRYGYYEARMKVPPGGGWHTSFWMMKYNRPATDTVAIELDVIENDSVTPLKYGVNVHRHLPAPHVTFGNKSVTTPSLSQDFHVLGCEFTPNTIKYYFEGALVQTVDATQLPHNDMNIWLTSIAAPLGGTTSVDDTQLPAVAQFDYVRYYEPFPAPTVQITSPSSSGVSLASPAVTLRLEAEVSSQSGTPAIAWSLVDGPGTVIFSDPAAAQTSASFSGTGTYTLQCAASNEGGTSTDLIHVGVAAPTTVELRQGVGGYSHTATILRGDYPSWNAGARDQILVGRNSAPFRSVFSFDLSPLPPDTVIHGAALDLKTIGGSGSVGALQLRALNATPVEGTGISDGTTGADTGAGTGATWTTRTGGTQAADLWSSAGGDYAADVLSETPGFDATVPGRAVTLPDTPALTAAVLASRTSGQPLDLILSATNELTSSGFSRIASDDAPLESERPALRLSITGNALPSVDPGTAPVAQAATAATLNGSATGADATLWQQVSGPASVAFANSALPSTTAVFPEPGTYQLKLSATNALGSVERGLTVEATGSSGSETLDLGAMVRPVPLTAKFTDPNYHIWCGSCVKGPDGKYHLFYSRWPKNNPNGFSPGWAIWSEVAYAIADNPGGPFTHVNVALPARGTNPATGQKYWDGDMTHNPYCIRKDGIYYLYYIGNYGDGTYEVHRNNDRIGVAWANSPAGPWNRLDQPVIDITPDPAGSTAAFDSLCVANPAITVMSDGKILVVYKGVKNSGTTMGGPVRYGAAIADTPLGAYVKQTSVAGQIFLPPGASNMEAEDPFIWYSARYGHRYYAVARDVVGTFTGVSGGLAQFESGDGLHWSASAQPKVLGSSFTWEGGQLNSTRVERPWVLLDETGLPIRLFGATNGYQSSVSYNVQIPLQVPPTVEIQSPANPAITLADTLTRLRLSAAATSGILPGGPAVSWSQISGPAPAAFENAVAAETSVSFPLEGFYVLRCTASDPAGSVSDDVSVAVNTPVTLSLRQGNNGYSHTAAMIRADNPTWNGGARDQMLVGRNSGKGMRTVLSFPLDFLPADGSVHSVSLDLWTAGDVSTAAVGPLQLKLLDGTPTEGTGNGQNSTAATSGTTWNHRTAQPDPGMVWQTAGGDMLGGVLSETPGYTDPATNLSVSFSSSPAFVAAAQSALTSAAPLDLMLYSPSTEISSTDALTRLASDDHSTSTIRPRLNVSFTGNFAPQVDPGPSPAAFVGSPAALNGQINHTTASRWSLLSGPGAAVFSNDSSAACSVTFDQAGTYLLKLSATGVLAETSRTLEIQVIAADPGTLAGWQAQNWPGVNDPNITGPGMDPDQDGLNNLLEWALNLDPKQPGTFQPVAEKIGNNLQYTYIRRKTAPGQAIYQVEWSDTLGDDWTGEGIVQAQAVPLTDSTESVTATIPAGLAGNLFVRVRVSTP
jgi:beta-glucanase (GH16 family)